MTSHTPARDPGQLEHLTAELTTRITNLGVTITSTALPAHKLACWNPHNTTLTIRNTAEDIDIVWVLHEFWLLHTVGEHACGGRRAPHLTAVS